MRTLHTTVIATAVVAIVVAALGALASETHPAPAPATSAGLAPGPSRGDSKRGPAGVGQRIQVTEHFVQGTPDNCQYETNVRGSLVRSAGGQFIPDLAIDANVHCLYSQGEHLTVRMLAGQSMSRDDLLRALSDRGAVQGVADGRVCTFKPTFAIDGDCLVARSVAESCERAGVGGGPDLDW